MVCSLSVRMHAWPSELRSVPESNWRSALLSPGDLNLAQNMLNIS